MWFKRQEIWHQLAASTGKCPNAIRYHAMRGYLPAGQTRPGHKGKWYTAAEVAECEKLCRIRGWMRKEEITLK